MREFYMVMEMFLYLHWSDIYIGIWICQNPLNVYLKHMYVIVCKLCFNKTGSNE